MIGAISGEETGTLYEKGCDISGIKLRFGLADGVGDEVDGEGRRGCPLRLELTNETREELEGEGVENEGIGGGSSGLDPADEKKEELEAGNDGNDENDENEGIVGVVIG